MAEGYLKSRLARLVNVQSAGMRPKPIHPLTIQVMEEIGLDIKGQHSKALLDIDPNHRFTYVITVCDAAESECPKSFAPSAVKHAWSFPDPVRNDGDEKTLLEGFRQVRDQIIKQIDQWVREEIPEHWRKPKGSKTP
jgi:arsenate reductase